MLKPCDCLNDCGDDPAVKRGDAAPCAHRLRLLAKPKVIGISRVADNDRALLVSFDKPATDDEMRSLHTHLRQLMPWWD